jgi:predicted unusual protein kinase regulating ubiquinone biosynthesis (AarF/ABC1/UbiB family)
MSLRTEKRDSKFSPALSNPRARMLAIFHKLGGFYIKIGQNGASREDFVPPQASTRTPSLSSRSTSTSVVGSIDFLC